MMKNIELIKRIDQLIRIKATGTPEDFSSYLGISKNTLYRIIKTMKQLNAPVQYDFSLQSYVYNKEVSYIFGFF